MRRSLVTLLLCVSLAALSGCASLGVESPFGTDPLTGGREARVSRLLDVPLPAGLEVYTEHGYETAGADGGRDGLETLRGNVDAPLTAQSFFSAMQGQGWQLRLSLRKGDRSLYLYDKGGRAAVLVFRRQAMLTIVEIWTGARLPDNATLSLPGAGGAAGADDGYAGNDAGYAPKQGQGGPASGSMDTAPKPGQTESWGNGASSGTAAGSGGLQERSL